MPILHQQFAAIAKTKDGKKAAAPSHLPLRLRGPLLQVTVTIEENAGKGLLAKGETLPTPKSGLALIDTGASNTCIDDKAAQELGLPIIDVGKMTSASHEEHPCNIYPVQINIVGFVSLNAPKAMGAALAAQGLLALIGRDVLERCTLFYNGPTSEITLSF